MITFKGEIPMNKIKELIDASVPARTISEIFSILKAYKEVFVE